MIAAMVSRYLAAIGGQDNDVAYAVHDDRGEAGKDPSSAPRVDRNRLHPPISLQQVHRNQGTTNLQYSLVEVARELGWVRDRVVVVEDDLGVSGSSAIGRVGFQRVLSEVALDHVGLIVGVEMSRLARSNKDWHQLLELNPEAGGSEVPRYAQSRH